jgi:hypothetical protein
MSVFMQSVQPQSTLRTNAPIMIGFNGFYVMVAYDKFDFGLRLHILTFQGVETKC